MLKFIDVEFPLTNNPPRRVSICNWSQRRYQHDMGKIRFADWNPDPASITQGTPIKITFTRGGTQKTHYGYIHHVTHTRTGDQSYVDIHVIGASYVMRQAAQKVYTNSTASAVVQQIATNHKFSYDVFPHPRVYPQIISPGYTEWELMVNLARKSGYTLRSEGSSIFFKPLTEDYVNMIDLAKEFVVTTPGSLTPPTLYSITPLVGESLEYEDAYKAAVAVSGQDPNSKVKFAVINPRQADSVRERVNPELFDRYDVKTSANSYSAAIHEVQAAQENNRFPYRAFAVVVGTPDLRPDMPIKLTGVNSDLDGHWIIIEANHVVEDGMYTTELEIGLDSLGATLQQSPRSDSLTVSAPVPMLQVSHTPVKPSATVRMSKVANRLSGNPTGSVSALWDGASTNLRKTNSATSKASQVLTR